MSSSTSAWARLPKELLEIIGKCLDSRLDVLRFRAVCNSWRSSVPLPPFDQEIPPVILHLPPPIRQDAVLVQTTVCRIELAPRFVSNSSALSRAWLTKVGDSNRGKLLLLDPFLNNPIRNSPFKLNLLDFRFQQLSKSFTLQQVLGDNVFGVNKVVLFPVSGSCSRNEFGILAIYHEGKLGYWKNGDEKWTLLDDENFQYDDIIEHKGKFYVVDRWGTVSWIDSSLKLIQYSPPLRGCGGRKNLVESCGYIYVVDRNLDGARRTWIDYENVFYNNDNIRWSRFRRQMRSPKATDFRVYKLDEDWGRWVDVKSLGDQVFVLGIDCSFSASYKEFYGGKGNCIYFTDEDTYSVGRGWVTDSVWIFQLEDHSIEKVLSSQVSLFWPPNFGYLYLNASR